jgi:AcrR family transcriptional regulator
MSTLSLGAADEITAQAKADTLERLLDAAGRRLRRSPDLTTREVARDAGVAHGTLFNYFPTKEALARAVCERELAAAAASFEAERRTGTTLEEDLFALVMAGLHRLAPFRSAVGELFREVPEAHASPARRLIRGARRRRCAECDRAATSTARSTSACLRGGPRTPRPSRSPRSAVLDRTLSMFVRSLEAQS